MTLDERPNLPGAIDGGRLRNYETRDSESRLRD